jgi:hypothetical protein
LENWPPFSLFQVQTLGGTYAVDSLMEETPFRWCREEDA